MLYKDVHVVKLFHHFFIDTGHPLVTSLIGLAYHNDLSIQSREAKLRLKFPVFSLVASLRSSHAMDLDVNCRIWFTTSMIFTSASVGVGIRLGWPPVPE